MSPTGIVTDLDEKTYHNDRVTLSQSGAKRLLQAPAKFRWEQDHPVHKDVFDFGKAAHRLVLGVGSKLIVHQYDADKVKSPKQTKAWKEEQAAARATDDVLLTPDEYATVQAMADKLSEHRMAMRLLSEGQPEVSAYTIDPATGVGLRGRCDWLGRTVISDYKTTTSSEPDTFLRNALKLGYHSQHAWYLDLFASCGHPAQAFAFIAQEKEPPYIVTVIELPEEVVELGRARNRRAIEIFRDCTESGLWPGYVPDDDFARPTAPAWMLREDIA